MRLVLSFKIGALITFIEKRYLPFIHVLTVDGFNGDASIVNKRSFSLNSLAFTRFKRLKETIKGFNMILDGEVDQYPESAFNLKGTIEEAIEAGEKMLAEAAAEA